MSTARPLKVEEVPVQYRDKIDFNSFRTEEVAQKTRVSKKQSVVDVFCIVCGERKPTSVNNIRTWIRGIHKNFPGTHRACKYPGRIIANGYAKIYKPDHPRNTGRYVPEHIIVMEESLGRYLSTTETVHHINGDRLDNSLNNLQLRQGSHGKGQKWECVDCGSHNVIATQL